MALAAVQRATSFIARPAGRRLLATRLVAGAAAAWTPRAWAETVHTSAKDEAQPAPECQPSLPPAANDGLDALRCRIREYGLRPLEEKLVSLMREFKADEKQYLKWYEEAERKGDDKGMRMWHSSWKEKVDRMELLHSNPRKFVRKHGSLYDLETRSIFYPFF